MLRVEATEVIHLTVYHLCTLLAILQLADLRLTLNLLRTLLLQVVILTLEDRSVHSASLVTISIHKLLSLLAYRSPWLVRLTEHLVERTDHRFNLSLSFTCAVRFLMN